MGGDYRLAQVGRLPIAMMVLCYSAKEQFNFTLNASRMYDPYLQVRSDLVLYLGLVICPCDPG